MTESSHWFWNQLWLRFESDSWWKSCLCISSRRMRRMLPPRYLVKKDEENVTANQQNVELELAKWISENPASPEGRAQRRAEIEETFRNYGWVKNVSCLNNQFTESVNSSFLYQSCTLLILSVTTCTCKFKLFFFALGGEVALLQAVRVHNLWGEGFFARPDHE